MIYGKEEKGKSGMKHKLQRLISAFLALLLVIGLVPTTAFAAPMEKPQVRFLADVDGSQQEVSGASINFSTTDNQLFTVNVPGNAADAVWKGWGDNNIVAAVVLWNNDKTESAYSISTDGDRVTFRLNTYDTDALDGTCIVKVIGGVYRSGCSITVDGADKGEQEWGTTYQLPATADVPEGEVLIAWKDQNGHFYAPGGTAAVTEDIDFEAVTAAEETEENQYVVTFQDGAGNVISGCLYHEGDTVDIPGEPARAGYTFAGWSPAVENTVNENAVYTAQWTADANGITYTGANVSFSGASSATAGDSVIFAAEAAEGYIISSVAASAGGEEIPVVLTAAGKYTFVMPESEVTVSAEAAEIPEPPADHQNYTVRFETYDGSLVESKEVKEGETVSAPETTPTREGYTFEKWATADGTVFSENVPVNENITYIAQFTEITAGAAADEKVYVVNFKGLDGKIYDTLLATADNGYTVTTPAFPELAGYEQATMKWVGSGVSYDAGIDIKAEADAEYTLEAAVLRYGITVVSTPEAVGQESVPADAVYAEAVVLTVKTPEGYVLKGITVTGDESGNGIVVANTNDSTKYTFVMPAEAVTVNVEYEEVPAGKTLVKFVSDGALYDYQIVARGTELTAPPAPVKPGYSFESWKLNDSTAVTAGGTYKVPEDADDEITFTARWTAENYIVSYDLNGGMPVSGADYSAANKNYGDVITLPVAPEKENYLFIGWLGSQSNMIYNAGAKYTVTGAVTFTAQWEAAPGEEYVVRFVDTATGILYGYEVVAEGETVTAPQAPVRTGYTFNRWTDAANVNNSVAAEAATSPITSNTVFVADWTAATYNVQVKNTNCTVDIDSVAYAYNAAVEFTVTSEEDYAIDTVYIRYAENGNTSLKVLEADKDDRYRFIMPGADVELFALAKKTAFSVTAQADDYLKIEGYDRKAQAGQGVSFTVRTINQNYSVGNVYVETETGNKIPVSVVLDDDNNPVYHFTMPESDVTIYAQQIQNEYSVYYLDSDNTILAIENIKAGEKETMKVQTGPEGYTFEGWKLLMTAKDIVYAAGEKVTIEEDTYLQAVYRGESHTVSPGIKDNLEKLDARLSGNSNGSVNMLGTSANVLNTETGATICFDVAAKYNWKITDITITSDNSDTAVSPLLTAKNTITDAEGNECELLTYSFTMPDEDVKINVYTEAKEYNVKVTENIPEAGDYTINGYSTTNHGIALGSRVQIAIEAFDGYVIDKVEGSYTNALGNAARVNGTFEDGVYSFTMVPYDVTVAIEYAPVELNVNVTNSNGTQGQPNTYNPQIPGAKGTASETQDVDNQGYIALLDEEGNEIFDDGKQVGIYYPANAEYFVGDLVKFDIKTYRGWVLDRVAVTYAGGTRSCQLTLTNGIYYFNMPAADDVTITASWVKDNYSITRNVEGEAHGSILMNGLTENKITTEYKDGVNITVTPDPGYYVEAVSYRLSDTNAADFSNGASYAGTQLTDTVDGTHEIDFVTPSSDVTVTVKYGKINYTLQSDVNGTVSSVEENDTLGGKLSLSTVLADIGDEITVTTEPKHGYKLVSLYVQDSSGALAPVSLKQTEAESNVSEYTFTMPAKSVAVYADFQKVDYVVTYVNYDNTVVAMEGVTYQESADVNGHAANVVSGPDGQHFIGWVSDDVKTPVTTPSTTNADFVVVNDTMVKAVFAYDQTDVVFNATVNGETASEGNKTPEAFVLNKEYKDQVTFTVTPDVGYEVDTVTVTTKDANNDPIDIKYTTNDSTHTFTIPATYKPDVHTVQSEDVVVNVTFKTAAYTLTKDRTSGTNGTVAVNGLVSTQTSFNYQYNDEVSITATPDEGYYVASIIATGTDNTEAGRVENEAPAADTAAGDETTLTFRMPAEDVTYKVTYAKIDYTITRVYNDVHGKVEIFDKVGNEIDRAQIDDRIDIAVTPNKGYALKSLTVTYKDGTQSVVLTGGAENAFTFKMPAGAVKVTAVFTEVAYTVGLTKQGQGNVTLNTYFTSNMNADYLDTVTVNATPASGWHLVSITVTGDDETGDVGVAPKIDPAGGDYTFTMPNCNVQVEVVFEKNDYSITVINDDSQGTVTTAPQSQVGDIVSINIKPNRGYTLDELSVTYADGQKSVALTKVGDNSYTFTMPAADVTVAVVYKTVAYRASLDKSGEGTVRLNGYNTTAVDANYKDTVSVEVIPKDGWYLKSILVAGGDVEVLPAVQENGGEYTFTMPDYDVEVSVVMEKYDNAVTTYAVNAYEDGHGTVTMNASYGQVGDKMTITADPDDGYRVKRIVVTDAEGNSVPVSFVSESTDHLEKWSFTMPASAVEIKIVFEVYAASYYTDCRTDDWYYEAVTYLADQGLMTGITDNLFGPKIQMTRAMFVTVLARMEAIDAEEWADVDPGFTDTSVNAWYAPYVAWAKANGVTTGYTDGSGKFGVSDPITREQMFTMMYRYAESKGIDMTVTYPQFIERYVDKNQISAYAYDAIVWCVSEGVAKGMTGTTINPKDYAPRSHAAQMFKNYIDNAWYM